MSREITKKYTNGEVTIVWKPDLCAHSGICFQGLPEVFKPAERPWIVPGAASTTQLVHQVSQCPSSALSYFFNAGEDSFQEETTEIQIEVRPGGPLWVTGNVTIKHQDGTTERRERKTSLCRCGRSRNKPFCDSSHKSVVFDI